MISDVIFGWYVVAVAAYIYISYSKKFEAFRFNIYKMMLDVVKQ